MDGVLTDAEVQAFWEACDAIDGENLSTVRFGAMFKLMLLTGARRNEVAGMSDVEIMALAGCCRPSAPRTARRSGAHLTKTALAILKSLPRIEGRPYVSGRRARNAALGFRKLKIASTPRLRRSRRHGACTISAARSALDSAARYAEEIAERCINHPPAGLKATYDRHEYDAPMRDAWTRWERHVLKTIR